MAHKFTRVVIVNDTTVARGGAAQLAMQLTRNLVARGVKVMFFAGDDGENEELAALGVDVVSIGGEPLLTSRRGAIDGIYNQKAAQRLKALIADIDGPDVVYHVHAWAQILSPSVFAALAPVAERSVVTAHDFFLACPNGNFSIYPKSRQCELRPMSARCIATHCDKRRYAHKLWRVARQAVLNAQINFKRLPFSVLAIQAGMTPYLSRGGVPEKQISILTNPAVQMVEARVPAERNREILYVGRLEHEKGVDILAEAARASGAPLRIIGSGSDEATIRQAYPDAIFQGWATQSEIAEAFRRARFFVMPTRCTEPFGLAAAEALRAGLPVLTSASCLIGAEVKQKGMGDVCDIFDAAVLRDRISDWMRDDGKIKSMSAAAFERASEIAQTESAWVDGHLAFYDRLVAAAALD